jgi:mannose-6-phosphate isomerase-like protein (cupin superfamily)
VVVQLNATTRPGGQLWFLDGLITIRVAHDEGGDGISVLEHRAPYGEAPPLHVHREEDETFFVLDGALRLRAGDAEVRIGPGEAALAPARVPHTYRVESAEGARWLVVTTHGDFERFVRALGRPAQRDDLPAPQGPPTPEEVRALAVVAREHGIELVGPPLSP